MDATRLTFGKPFVKKQYNVLVFLIVSARGVEVPVGLSEDCYFDLSVPIPNGCTLGLVMSQGKSNQIPQESLSEKFRQVVAHLGLRFSSDFPKILNWS